MPATLATDLIQRTLVLRSEQSVIKRATIGSLSFNGNRGRGMVGYLCYDGEVLVEVSSVVGTRVASCLSSRRYYISSDFR